MELSIYIPPLYNFLNVTSLRVRYIYKCFEFQINFINRSSSELLCVRACVRAPKWYELFATPPI